MAKICACIAEASAAGCLGAIKKAKGEGAQLAELRIDYLRGDIKQSVAKIIKASSIPIIATCRRPQDGGKFGGSEQARAMLLELAISAGAAYVDVELGSASGFKKGLVARARKAGCAVIVSYHDFEKTPPKAKLGKIVEKCFECKGDIAKIACMSNGAKDNSRLLGLLGKGKRLIVIGMGKHGLPTRLVAPMLGSEVAFASSGKGKQTAPGQLEVGKLAKALDDLKTPKTRLFASTGNPILQSTSPQMHNAAFAALGIDARYFRLLAASGREALATAKQMGICGMNVTTPFKEEFLGLMDEVSPEAKKIGAINTVLLGTNGKAKGFNTDTFGVSKAFAANGVDLKGKNAVVIGAGGAAKAAVHALVSHGAAVTVANRTVGKAIAISKKFNCDFCSLDAKELGNAIGNAQILVSTLSTPEMVVDPKLLHGRLVLLDALYWKQTAISKDATARGCKVISGQEWLLYQGTKAFELFSNKKAPVGIMRQALEGARSKSAANKKENLALIGFMGAGKSSTATNIARLSGMKKVDTDKNIEQKAGASIAKIFEKFGEETFRAMEREEMSRLGNYSRQIISCGGGAVLDKRNARALQGNCTVAWLYASPQETAKRIGKDSHRPLLSALGKIAAAKKLLAQRMAAYASCCDFAVGTQGKTPDKCAKMILKETEKMLPENSKPKEAKP